MIVFQNKIIYMPSMPPFARSERIDDYASMCKPVIWTEQRLRSKDGVEVALAVGSIPSEGGVGRESESQSGIVRAEKGRDREVVIVYFQG